MKAKLSPNLISYVAIRRGNWILKISVYKHKTVLVVAQNYYDTEKIELRHFNNQEAAANFIDLLISNEEKYG
jgi:hypothetical protein